MARNRPPKIFIFIHTLLQACWILPKYLHFPYRLVKSSFCYFGINQKMRWRQAKMWCFCWKSFSDFLFQLLQRCKWQSRGALLLVEFNRLRFCAGWRSFKKVSLLKVPLLLTNPQKLKMLIPWFKTGSTDLMFLPQIRKALMGVDQPDLLWSTRLHLSLPLSGNRDVLSQSGPAT